MRLVIIGAGFAGMYAALSAARLRDIQGVSPEELEIALVAPEPTLVVRPRLYEPKPETLTAPLLDVLKAIDVIYVQGSAETIDTKSRTVASRPPRDARRASPTIAWSWPPAAGCSVRIFPASPSTGSVSTHLDDAMALDKHLHALAGQPAMNGRDTVVVAGGGFTGIEAATEMPSRLREILGKDAKTRVIIVDRNKAIAPDMGEGPRPVIEDALRKLGVETRLGAGVASLDKSGVTLSRRRTHRNRNRDLGGRHSRRPVDPADPRRTRQLWPAAGRPLLDRAGRSRRVRHRRCRSGRMRRCRQLRADVVPARHADGRLCRQQRRRRIARRSDQALPPGGLRHLPRPRRSRRAVHARLGARGDDGRRRRPRRPSRRSTPSGSIRRRPSVPPRWPRPIRSV